MQKRPRQSLLGILLSRLRKEQAPLPARAPAPRFQAIAIFRGVRACEVARKFSDRRFLAREAPALPLSACTMPKGCECKYMKFSDRRAEPRRLVDYGTATRVFASINRRSFRGRRKTDS